MSNIRNIKYIFLLNLIRRLDKLNFMKYKLHDMNIENYKVISGIDGNCDEESNNLYVNYLNTLKDEDYSFKDKGKTYIHNKSVFAIIKSFKLIFEQVLNLEDDEPILILEDDVIFHKNFNEYKIDFSYDVIYLGGNQLQWDKIYTSNYSLINDKRYITYGLYAIILKAKFIKNFYKDKLNNLNNIRKPLDHMIWEYIVENKMSNIVHIPNLVIPNLISSDNMLNRDLIKISKYKRWILKDYRFVNLELKYYKIYKMSKKMDIRKIKGHIDWLYFDTIYKIVNGEY